MGSKEIKLPKNMTNSEVKDFVKKFKDKADDQADIAKITVKKEPENKNEYFKVFQSDPDVKEFIKLRKMLKSAGLL